MAHLLGLNVPEIESSQTQGRSAPIYHIQGGQYLTPPSETALSPLSPPSQGQTSPDFYQPAHSYPDYGPFYGYDFQSFTESDNTR